MLVVELHPVRKPDDLELGLDESSFLQLPFEIGVQELRDLMTGIAVIVEKFGCLFGQPKTPIHLAFFKTKQGDLVLFGCFVDDLIDSLADELDDIQL